MKYYIVDAFTDELFSGNPAGVCLPEEFPPDAMMQKIAFENNQTETAFAVKREGYYDLRWFTPKVEVDLCGHATLATAYVLMNRLDRASMKVEFHTRSGVLTVTRRQETLFMDFPTRKPVPCVPPPLLEKALGVSILEAHRSRDLLVLVDSQEELRTLAPDFALLGAMKGAFAVIVTAKGNDCDFVSRFFAPNAGINEDPVTGSSHCTLIPFWSERLHKTEMTARQLSPRGGMLFCRSLGERVEIGGNACCYLTGEILPGRAAVCASSGDGRVCNGESRIALRKDMQR